jgi:hypothetical protein
MDRIVGGVVFKAYRLKVSLKSRQSSEAIGGPGPAGFWIEQMHNAARSGV